jgi:hypothetical protein
LVLAKGWLRQAEPPLVPPPVRQLQFSSTPS